MDSGLNMETVVKAVIGAISVVPHQSILLENPSTQAQFPCVVLSEPLANQKHGGCCYNLSVKREGWAGEAYKALELSDQMREQLSHLNFKPASPIPLSHDLIGKWRCGSYYEARWNAQSNTFERNR